MPDPETPISPVTESKVVPKKRTRLSLVWFIPIVAALVGVWVAVTRILSEGPKITIVLRSAQGLEAGKTKVRYKGVEVGTVTTIAVSDDHQRAVTTVQMVARTEGFLVDDTKFWVVRPRISGANVTGLRTLISGSYVGMEIGRSKARRRDFVALRTPPVVTSENGRFFMLKTPDLGSLGTGTPVFFRRLQVGEVVSYELDRDGKLLTVKVFVQAPYDQYVNPDTRFWHASGIDVSLSASGLEVQTQSVLSILIGGIAFETAATGPVLPPAAAKTVFTLYRTRAEAFAPAARDPHTYQLIFNESIRGLAAGAPVEFRGIPIGEVVDVRAQIDLKTFEFSVPVTIRLDPERLGVNFVGTSSGVDAERMRRKLVDSLVTHRVRAQLRSANLLTGAVYVAFDVFPGATPASVDWARKPVQFPTVPGELQATEATVESILNKINQMPLKALGDNLREAIADFDLTLVSARGTLVSAQGTFDNTSNLTGPNSAQLQQLEHTLGEVSRAAQSVRVLADYLERHPEALLRGKKGTAK